MRILAAMSGGVDSAVATARARSSLRFSLGHTSTGEDVDAVLDVIAPVVDRARRAGMGRS